MKMKVRALVKALLSQEGMTLTSVAPLLEEKTGRKYTMDTLSQRLGRGTFSYDEMLVLCEILGYEIKIEKL